jgi:two-component system chemotaxis response regulator CheY
MTDNGNAMTGARPQSILIVEDERTIRMIIKRIIMRLGIPCVREASDGSKALSILKNTPVDFVITDWGMPSISGLELLYLMHQDRQLMHVPVLFLTGRSDEQSVQRAIETGANGYLIKPLTPELLVRKLEAMFLQRAQSRL